MPRFSIVIPTRNRAHYLEYALRSALNQQFDDYEIVVSNNNSRDNTERVVRQFMNGRVRLVNPGRDLSMTEHWEYAFLHATGEYVIGLSDDDAISLELLLFLDRLISSTLPDVVTFDFVGYHHADHPRAELRGWCQAFPMTNGIYRVQKELVLREVYRLRRSFGHPKILFSCIRRDVFDRARAKVGRIFYPTCPDISGGVVLLAFASSVFVVDRPLAVGGSGKDSIGGSGSRNAPAFQEHLALHNHGHTLVPLTNSSNPNETAESLLLAKQCVAPLLDEYELDWRAYFWRNELALAELKSNRVDVANYDEELAQKREQFHSSKILEATAVTPRRLLQALGLRFPRSTIFTRGEKWFRRESILDLVGELERWEHYRWKGLAAAAILARRRRQLAAVGAQQIDFAQKGR